MNEYIKTYFASPDRSDLIELLKQKSIFDNMSQLSFFLDSTQTIYLILNNNRQIVFANKTALEFLGKNDNISIFGMRPGEAIGCLNSNTMPGGCGSSEACSRCNAVNAILAGLDGITEKNEFSVSTHGLKDTFDFSVNTSPLTIDKEKFVIFSITDISGEKRRRALERIFFHDVLNTAGGIQGISNLIHHYPEEVSELKDILFESSNRLVNEIKAQRDLTDAENNELKVNFVNLNSGRFINLLVGIYSNLEISKNKNLMIADDFTDCDFESDEVLLMRVLVNMTKNALEASDDGGTITLNCSKAKDSVIFSVHNSNYIPKDIQLQIFRRSFSTKGEGRGLGTYSMKLLCENYLGGKISFITNEQSGTLFLAVLPDKIKI